LLLPLSKLFQKIAGGKDELNIVVNADIVADNN
jgi:hypothetical protein